MYSNSAGVEGGNACRRDNGKRFVRTFGKLAQERGLTGACFSGKENMGTCAVDKSDSNIRNAFLEHVRGHRVFIFTCLLGPGITRMVQLAALQVCEMPGANQTPQDFYRIQHDADPGE